MNAHYLFLCRISCRLVFMFEGLSCNDREDFYLNIDRVDAQPLLLYDDYRAGVMSLPTM
jgi:hypothetical protein